VTVEVFQLAVYGDVIADPITVPSTIKSTRVTNTPEALAALAERATVRFTVAPGDARLTVGGALVMVGAVVLVIPAVSLIPPPQATSEATPVATMIRNAHLRACLNRDASFIEPSPTLSVLMRTRRCRCGSGRFTAVR
jgi:hypothetical protein